VPGLNPEVNTSSDGDVEEEVSCWHGTGSLPADNIYEDTQDGFMMQFASAGFWGRGLYFAKDPGCECENPYCI
jgi:hypothetical protein